MTEKNCKKRPKQYLKQLKTLHAAKEFIQTVLTLNVSSTDGNLILTIVSVEVHISIYTVIALI